MNENLVLIASYLVPILSVGLLVAYQLRRAGHGFGWLLFGFTAAIPISFGTTSVLGYISFHLFGYARRRFILLELVLFGALLVWSIFCLSKKAALSFKLPKGDHTPLTAILMLSFAVCLAVSYINYCRGIFQAPYGDWDAWAVWSHRAAFLFRAGDEWRRAFSPVGIEWQHSDYPLLVPIQIVLGWLAIGGENPIIPAVVASSFGAAVLAALVICVGVARGWSLGFLCGIMVLIHGKILGYAARMYADVPLSSLMLSCLLFTYVAFNTPKNKVALFWAGAAAGLCAWTKNEGMTFCLYAHLCLAIVLFFSDGLRTILKKISCFALGASIGLLPTAHFKLMYAASNDLLRESQGAADRFFDLPRYEKIYDYFLVQYQSMFTPLAMCLVFSLLGFKWRDINKRFLSFFLILYCAVMMTFFFVYVTTPHELEWHLQTSADRLFMQTYPFVYAGFFLLLPRLETVHARLAGISATSTPQSSLQHETTQ